MSNDRLASLEIEELYRRLDEAESALEAIRRGDVESLIIEGPGGPRIFSLEGAGQSYRVLVEAMNEGAATLSAEATILYSNARLAEMLGSSLERVMGSSLFEWIPPDSRKAMAALLDEARDGESRGELELRRADGRDVPTTVSFKAFYDNGCPLVCLVAVDLSEHKRSEQLLAEGRLARSVLDQAAEVIVVCDEHGRITRANRTAEQLARCGPLRVDFDTAFPLVLSSPLVQGSLAANALGGVIAHAEPATLARLDGTEASLLVSASPLRDKDERVIGCVVTMIDVTEHRRTEDEKQRVERAARETEQRLAAVMEALPVGVAITDAKGANIACNAAFEQIWGAPRPHVDSVADYGAYKAWWVDTGQPLAPEEWASARVIETGEPVVGQLVEIERFDGSRAFVLNSAAPVLDAGGSIIGAAVALQDVSELRRAELELREADRQKNQFLAVLSHELRNPLTPIRNGLFILQHAPPGGEQADRARAVIERQVTHLTRLVDDLLDVTRIASGKLRMQPARFDLARMLSRIVEDHRMVFAAERIEFAIQLCPGPVWTFGDEARVAQAVGNLLANAAKFTAPGGRVTLVSTMDREAHEAEVQVRDTGIGVQPDLLPRLFEPFVQADETLDRAKGGLGLGLALVKTVVELHGGKVAARSAGLGAGTEFVVRLPLDAQAALPPGEGKRPSSRPPQRRILIIEDNRDSADSLRDILELGAHRVEVAYSGPQGLEVAREFGPEVVLCDIGLPGMSGYEVAKALRADERLGSAHLVALTGYALPEDQQRAKDAGFGWHVAKPPSPDKIEQILAEMPKRERP